MLVFLGLAKKSWFPNQKRYHDLPEIPEGH